MDRSTLVPYFSTQHTNVLVCPDLGSANIGYKLLEYMASGAAVVSTKLEGIPQEYWGYITACEPTADGLNEAILGSEPSP